MAKTPKVKKREVSLHSRAARRQNTPPPSIAAKSKEDDSAQPWLYHAQNAGVSKKRKTRQLTRQQRLRQQKGFEHAERNIDKMEKKVKDSKQRGKKVRERRAEWEELNGTVPSTFNEEEAEDDMKEIAPRESWTDKIVDVELQEAMGEIQGIQLPQQHIAVESKNDAMETMFGNGDKIVEAAVKKDVDEVDDIS